MSPIRTIFPGPRGLSQRAFDPELREKPSYEYRILRADTGELRWVLAHGEAIFQKTDGGSRAVRYLGTIQDITERKRTETALADSEMTQRLAIEAAGMALVGRSNLHDAGGAQFAGFQRDVRLRRGCASRRSTKCAGATCQARTSACAPPARRR